MTERRLEEFSNDALPPSKRFKMIFLTIINGRSVFVKSKKRETINVQRDAAYKIIKLIKFYFMFFF